MIGWTRLTFDGGVASHEGVRLNLSEHSLVIDSDVDSLILEDDDVCGVSKGIVVWFNPVLLTLVVASQIAAVAYIIRLSTSMKTEEFMYRDEEPDLRHLYFAVAPDDSLLGIYERGILLIRGDGAVAWHRLHDDISARLLEVTEDRIVLETQWPTERSGALTYYRLADGEQLAAS